MPSISEADRPQVSGLARTFLESLPLRQINLWLIGLLVFYALAVTNCCRFFLLNGGQLQATSIVLNRCLSGAAFFLPVVVLLVYLASSATYKWWAVTALSLLAIPSTLLACFSFVMEPPKLLQSLQKGNIFIRCFRVPDLDFYVVDIEQQWTIVPGVVWSVPVRRESMAQGVTATVVDEHHLRCTFVRDKHFADAFTAQENNPIVPID